MTREERNVLVFVAIGVLLGSLPSRPSGPGSEGDGAPVASGPVETVEADLFPIDLNRAGAELLEQLPGIGPAKAGAILAWRDEHGPFRSVDQLDEVRGIGPRTVERLRDLVTVGGLQEPPDEARERGDRVGTTRDATAGEPDHQSGAARAGPQAAEVQR